MKNETGYRGVRKSRDSWRAKPYFARIRDGDRVIYTERCATAIGAAMDYDAIARQIHGSKAVLNFGKRSMRIQTKQEDISA